MEFTGTSGNDTLTGGSESDVISGLAGDDSLTGGGGDDSILGGAGDDSLYGGKGNDTLDGGDNGLLGDTVYYNGGNGANVNLVTGIATDGVNGTDLLLNVENIHGGDNNDLLQGDGNDNRFWAGPGNDTVNGGAGIDTVSYEESSALVEINLATGVGVGAAVDNDTLTGIERVIGSAFNDKLTLSNAAGGYAQGGAGNDSMTGGTNDDGFEGGAGNDTIAGGAGFDTVSYAGSTAGVTVELGGSSTGTADDGFGGTDSLASIEAAQGSAFSDTLQGSDVATLESFEGGAGSDAINGLGGIDRVSYESSDAGVVVNLTTGVASDGLGGTDSLQNIENILASAFNDTLTGSTANNELVGGAGDDSITGGAGNDTLQGGAGNDTLDGGAGNDVAVFTSNFAAYLVSTDATTGNIVVTGPEGDDTLRDIEELQFADITYTVVQGTAQADTLAGGADSELMRGGEGNDSLGGGGGDDALFGDEGNDSMEGGEGNDVLDGGEGADTMTGGTGGDTYYVNDEGDLVIEGADPVARAKDDSLHDNIGSSIDKVIASINYTLGNFVENLQLGGDSGLAGAGNGLNNAIVGNGGNNTLQGLGGNDQIDGGAGIDVAAFTAQHSQYSLSAGSSGFQVNDTTAQEGTDSLTNVERLQFADINVALDLTGNAGIVARILGAVFGRDSVSNEVYAGIGLDFSDGGMTYEALMQLALDARLGPGASHAAVVDLLYTNVVGGPPSAQDAQYFTGLLDSGAYTTASLGVLAAETSFNADNINLTGLAQTGLDYL